MLYDGTIEVAAPPDEAMRLFMDVPRMAALIPGASIEGRDDDGAWRGMMVVAFGPKRIRFNGKVSVAFEPAARSGTMLGRGVGDVRGAKVESKMTFGVTESPASTPASPMSRVSIHSDIALGGVLAEFARTGGPIVANALLKEFSARLSAELSTKQPATALGNVRAAAGAAPADHALRGDRLLWAALIQFLRGSLQKLLGKFSFTRR